MVAKWPHSAAKSARGLGDRRSRRTPRRHRLALFPRRLTAERAPRNETSRNEIRSGYVGPLEQSRSLPQAVKCYELAKNASPEFPSGFYRRIAVQYLFMAEGELKLVEKQDRVSERDG
jgi:hypothetical protein